MIIIILFISLFFYVEYTKYIKTRCIKKKENPLFTRKGLYQWMKLSKKERYKLSRSDSDNYLNKRKDLLEKIREEYKILKK